MNELAEIDKRFLITVSYFEQAEHGTLSKKTVRFQIHSEPDSKEIEANLKLINEQLNSAF